MGNHGGICFLKQPLLRLYFKIKAFINELLFPLYKGFIKLSTKETGGIYMAKKRKKQTKKKTRKKEPKRRVFKVKKRKKKTLKKSLKKKSKKSVKKKKTLKRVKRPVKRIRRLEAKKSRKQTKQVLKKKPAMWKKAMGMPEKKIAEKYAEAGPRDIRVVNIVVSTSLEHDIPLEKMAATLSNTEYNPEQFPGLVIRIKDPKTSALIFSSGKVVCTGARSMEKVQESIDRIIESLQKIGIKITITPKINIQNIVASGNIGMDLNLNVLAMKLDNTEYEPEQFPGLVYKLMEAKATFLLFSNGKVVCTGTKSEEEVHAALDKLVETLKAVK